MKSPSRENLHTFSITTPDDFHIHFRQGEKLKDYVQRTALWCERALVMPNTIPAIKTAEDALAYKEKILESLQAGDSNVLFTPLMTCKLYPDTSTDDIQEMRAAGVVACKLYPQGVTTHSNDGVADVTQLTDVYKAMADENIVLSIHGESPEDFVLDREKQFLEKLNFIQNKVPELKIVLEHLSCKEAVEYVSQDTSNKLAATITVHHLLWTLDDLIGGYLNPHLFCKPVLKTPDDRDALQHVVLQGNKKFFLGTDSAPHDIKNKECACGCAGVYSSPVALSVLTDFFYTQAPRDTWKILLENFTSKYGAAFYGLPKNTSKIKITKKSWDVPPVVDGVVPLCANKTMTWQFERE